MLLIKKEENNLLKEERNLEGIRRKNKFSWNHLNKPLPNTPQELYEDLLR